MADLIDRKELEYSIISEITIAENTWMYAAAVIDRVRSAPAVDAELVLHAHWEYDPNANDCGLGGWCCSKCHFKNDTLGMRSKLMFPLSMIAGTRYCGNCGAKMDEEVECNVWQTDKH